MATVLIVDDDRNVIKMLDFALQRAGFSVMVARDGTEGLNSALEHPPDVAVLDVMMPGIHGYELCRRLRADPKTAHTKVIMLTARSQPIDEQAGKQAGAHLFMSKPVILEDLAQNIRSLLAENQEQPVSAAEVEPQEITATAKPAEPAPSAEQRVGSSRPGANALHPHGHLAICLGGSPGVGVTTLATNLALALALYRQAETPLVELHSTPGNLTSALGLSSGPPFGDLAGTGTSINWDTLSLHLLTHPSGVCVLPAPPAGSDVPPSLTGRALSLLRARFPLVLADTATDLDDRVQPVVLSSNLVLLVLAPEVPTIRSTLRTLEALVALHYPQQQIMLVINQVRPQGNISAEQIQEGIKKPVLAVIPHEPAAKVAMELGKPLLLTQPTSPYCQAIGRLAMKLAHAFGEQK